VFDDKSMELREETDLRDSRYVCSLPRAGGAVECALRWHRRGRGFESRPVHLHPPISGRDAGSLIVRIGEKPIVKNGGRYPSSRNLEPPVRSQVVDGAPAARFLQRIKKLLENPSPYN
jgi:hypothetical protein